jgi:hypothetical protein
MLSSFRNPSIGIAGELSGGLRGYDPTMWGN